MPENQTTHVRHNLPRQYTQETTDFTARGWDDVYWPGAPVGQAGTPFPADAATGVDSTADVVLTWTAVPGAHEYKVYFGEAATPVTLVATTPGDVLTHTIPAADLDVSTQYFWRVDAQNPAGVTAGVIWDFTTAA